MRKSLSSICFGITVAVSSLSTLALAQHGKADQFVPGESTVVDGNTLSTWARVNGAGKVTWVGLTLPMSVIANMPAAGNGPAGSFAVLHFPPIVQQTTYFNHVQIHANPFGHHTEETWADPTRYWTSHYDVHYFGIPVEDVAAIPFEINFTPADPAIVPVGWFQPEPVSVPQMGRHTAPLSEATATDRWMATMMAGFLPDASMMHFIEPMVTQELLMSRRNFTLPVPMPATLGRSTRYPTVFVAQYDRSADAYHFIFKDFVSFN